MKNSPASSTSERYRNPLKTARARHWWMLLRDFDPLVTDQNPARAHQRATTSTSPSTPLTTLKGRSNTFPSFLAMARYSPSDNTTRGNAPIDSLMTSPPGVITDQAVFARASPPLSLTSFSVMTAARWVMTTSVSLLACTP